MYRENNTKGHDTLESFLLKVTFESYFRKKTFQCVMTLRVVWKESRTQKFPT